MMKEKDEDYTVPPIFDDMLSLSPKISSAIYALINEKNNTVVYPCRTWTAEFLENREWWDSKCFGMKLGKSDGYIVVIRGKRTFPVGHCPGSYPPPGPPPPGPPPPAHCSSGPPPPGWSPGGRPPGPPPPSVQPKVGPPGCAKKSVKTKKKTKLERKPLTHIQLTQEETELAINDFLATFSTLYDGIPVEERGDALRGINLNEIPELVEDDSDSSSDLDSGSSTSSSDD